MARQSRVDIEGEIYHIINRANARWRIFKTPKDYEAVINTLEETIEKLPIDIFSFTIMPNHWHFSVRPRHNGDVGRFFGKFTQKATQRWHAFHKTIGSGHLFQGRFKSFLIETDSYFIQLMKYIEANPLRAKLVDKAEDWQWGSLYLRTHDPERAKKILCPWPVDAPSNYLTEVNKPLPKVKLKEIRNSVVKGKPLGTFGWAEKISNKYNLNYTFRKPGRPQQ